MNHRPYMLALFFGFILGMHIFLLLDSLRILEMTDNDTVNMYMLKMLSSGLIGSLFVMFGVFLFLLVRRNHD